MGLQFYIGGSGAGKSKKLYWDVIEWSRREPGTTFLIIVPDQFTMQTQKELVTMHPDSGIMNIDVLSFGRLSHRIFEEVGGSYRPVLDDTGKSLVLRKIAADMAPFLQVLGSNLKRTGYIHEVKSVISEFMQYGIGDEELAGLVEFSRGRGALYHKLQDLAILYKEFRARIEGKFVTTEGSVGLLAKELPRASLVRDSVVVFDGFTGFTPVQNQVIRRMLTLAREVIVTVLMDGAEDAEMDDGPQKLFYLSKKTVRSLERMAEEEGAPRRKDVRLRARPVQRFRGNPSMAHLEQELFRFRSRTFTRKQDSIHIVEASSPSEEVRQTCLQICRLVREEHCQYRDIAVITGDLGAYADHVEEEFARFGIPCFLDATRGISMNPFTEYIRSALQIVIRNFSYESVFHFLRSGLAGIQPEDVDMLENYVLELGIRGRKKWTSLFTRKTKEMEDDSSQLERLNEIRRQVADKLEPLFGRYGTAREYVDVLYDFIAEDDIQRKLSVYEEHFAGQNDLAKAKEYGQIYRLVMQLLEQIAELIGEEKMTLREFADIMDAGFGEIQVGTIPQNVDRILVGDMERTRLQEIKYLFFLGINDGNIPRSSGTGGLISDIDREFLTEGQWEMAPSPRQRMYIQRLYLYMNMTKPSRRLYLSYARVDNGGKSLRPAYLIETVRRLFPGMAVELPELLPREQQIESKEDGISLLAEELRQYARGEGLPGQEPFLFSLYQTYRELPEYGGELERLLDAAFYRYRENPLKQQVAQALYGSVLYNSVSRLEKYAACAYSYFLQYGLSLQERREYGFEDVDMGNIFHGVLESFSGKLEEGGEDWFSFSRETGERFVEEAVDGMAASYGETVLFSSARNLYAVKRMKRILKRTVFTLQDQLKKGRFQPDKFEVSFSVLEDLDSVNIALSEKERMRLQGRIDRVDVCGEGDDIYVKVIDYKSGSRSLDIAAVYYGLQLQLVVYLNAAMDLLRKENPTKKVLPAAVLYYHIFDPMIQTGEENITPEQVNEKMLGELRMTGLVNDSASVVEMLDESFGDKSLVIPVERKKDGSFSSRSGVLPQEDLQMISSYVNRKIRQIGREILDGNIARNPFEKGQENACAYCAYKGVCGFDGKLPGCRMRKLPALKTDEALKKMREKGE